MQAGDGRAAVRGAAVPARQPGADLREEGSGAGRGGRVRARTGENARVCSRGGGTPAFAGKSELTGEQGFLSRFHPTCRKNALVAVTVARHLSGVRAAVSQETQ